MKCAYRDRQVLGSVAGLNARVIVQVIPLPRRKYAGTVLVASSKMGATIMASPSIHCLSMRKDAVSAGQLKNSGRMTEQPLV